MPFFESPAVYAVGAVATANTYLQQHLGLDRLAGLRFLESLVMPLVPTAGYYVRRDRFDRHNVVNVFARDGSKVYTFERKLPLNPVWAMRSFPHRHEVAAVRAGFFSTSVLWHRKQGLEHRTISRDSGLGGRHRLFVLADGKYLWLRDTKTLERVVNPGARQEEVRERVAKVKLLRQFKFDFEVLVDEGSVDREVVLATAFVLMLTQWGYGDITETTGPTFIPEAEPAATVAPGPGSVANKKVVMRVGDSVTIEL